MDPVVDTPPNIVVILADDLGFGDLSCYNPASKIPTPRIDALAREGLSFLDAHAPAAVCTPSRYGLLTGRYGWRSALPYGVLYGYEPPLIEPERTTLASLLQGAGYRTACIGKWHLGLGFSALPGADIDFARPLPWENASRAFEDGIDFGAPLGGGPTELGFDRFFGSAGCPTCQPPYAFIEGDRFTAEPSAYDDAPPPFGRPGRMAPDWRHELADTTFAREAVATIEAHAGDERPLFLFLASDAPHEPCVDEVVPPFARGRSRAGPRGDLVWLFDWMVGEVVDALERSGMADNTLLFVTSDNGALPGDRVEPGVGMDSYRTYGHRSNGDWRGYKAHIWEGGHREPLIAHWPGTIAGGRVNRDLVGLTDLLATCASLLGIELGDDAGEDSADLLPILLDTPDRRAPRDHLIHQSQRGAFSIRRGRWKAIFGTEGSGGWPPPSDGFPDPDAPGQLYDLEASPREDVNLWSERPEVVAELRELLERYRREGRSIERPR